MSLFSKLLGFSAILMFFAAILFVVFGQVTVRKLRKNPDTKEKLGTEFTSGWDILNVAGALSTPKWLREIFSQSPLSGLSANYEALYQNTNRFDRILARVFWGFYVSSGFLMFLFILLNYFNFLD